jgi:formylglycine-generating enzyme required for sulfatase activity
VDERGQIVERLQGAAWQFCEQLPGGTRLEMVRIPSGRFMMGSRGRMGYEDEHPQHNVGVEECYMGKFPITQAQWQAVMGWLPRCRGRGADLPVDRVSWYDAWEFCRRLSKQTGRLYRLPSESEWEYACRAGTNTPFSFGETITADLANYVSDHTFREEPPGVFPHGSTPAGTYLPNAFGLYDMHGNVWEWCADSWHDSYDGAPADGSIWEAQNPTHRMLRGGCWHDQPQLCRSATRLKQVPEEAEDYFGFRVVLVSLTQDPEIGKIYTEQINVRPWKRLGAWWQATASRAKVMLEEMARIRGK